MTNHFQKRVAVRIAAVSVVLATVAAPAAWWVAREKSEESIVSLAIEESRRLIDHYHATDLAGPDAIAHAHDAAMTLSGGLFDIAEIYDRNGTKLAESMTRDGESLEPALPHHVAPAYTKASYDSFSLPGDIWVLRVFIPLRSLTTRSDTTGYFEGVRLVPLWQRQLILNDALIVAIMVSLASLLCGATLYPVVVHLAKDNESKALEVLASQAALIEGLRQSELALEAKVAQRTQDLQRAQARTKELLYNILPVELADELSATGQARAIRHESVSILFTDFSGFTQAAASMPADRMVAELNEVFAAFDDISDHFGVEKIKTIGDSYMAAAGLPKPCADHAHRCVRAGLHMLAYMDERNRSSAFKWAVRVGVHSGPVIAGVVGKRKYAFDVWGDTVNIASRMESAGQTARVNISAYTYDLVKDAFSCEYRGKVDAKGKGPLDMYFVTGEKLPESHLREA